MEVLGEGGTHYMKYKILYSCSVKAGTEFLCMLEKREGQQQL